MSRSPSRPIPPIRHAVAALGAFAVTLAGGLLWESRARLAGWAGEAMPVPVTAALAVVGLRPAVPAAEAAAPVARGSAMPADRAVPAALVMPAGRILPGGPGDPAGGGASLVARLTDVRPVAFVMPEAPSPAGGACDLSLGLEVGPLALVAVTIEAPCAAGGAALLHHEGLAVSVLLDAGGRAEAILPALAVQAVVRAEAGGQSAAAAVTVPEAARIDRAVLMWQGERGAELHAREFGADYDSPGHVWAGAPGDVEAALRGEGGMMLSLGDARIPGARMAEVYTFPTGMAARSGAVALSIETPVTATTCGRVIGAETIQISPDFPAPLRRELTLPVPGCELEGEWLVLSDMLEGLTIAAR